MWPLGQMVWFLDDESYRQSKPCYVAAHVARVHSESEVDLVLVETVHVETVHGWGCGRYRAHVDFGLGPGQWRFPDPRPKLVGE